MSLYLAIFDGDREVKGCLFGHYSDFGLFTDVVASTLGRAACPTLLDHSDCDGEWTLHQLPRLRDELLAIAAEFAKRPPIEVVGAFEHTAEHRARAASLSDCFHTVDGQNAVDALLDLCSAALSLNLPIVLQ